MSFIFKYLRGSNASKFRENFIKVASANLAAKLISFLSIPLLTRLYTPVDFGVAALFSSTLSIIVAFSTWRFDWSVPNASTKKEAFSLIFSGFLVLLVITFLLFSTVIFLGENLEFWSRFEKLEGVTIFLPLAVAGQGIVLVLKSWFIWQGDLTIISQVTIIETGVKTLLSAIGGTIGLSYLWLILSNIISTWVVVSMLLLINLEEFKVGFLSMTRSSLSSAVETYGREATASTIVSLINAVGFSTPVILFTQFYSSREVGWYALMTSLIAAPIGIFSSALGQSFWSESAKLARNNQIFTLNRLYLSTTRKLALASLVIVFICATGPYFVGPLFGKEDWNQAGYILFAMTPMFLGSIIFSPTNHLIVFSKQSLQVFGDLLRLILTSSSIYCLSIIGTEFVYAVLLSSICSFIGHLILFYFHLQVHSKKISNLI
jgi:O-antigen/teichoic acid export membrane protein